MGMKEWFGGLHAALAGSFAVERKSSAAWGAILAAVVPNNPVWTDERYDRLADEGYRKQLAVFIAVNYVATALKGIPFVVYRKGEDGGLEALPRHPLQGLLDRPNPKQTGAKWREQSVGYFLLSGNLYWEGFGPTSGPNSGRFAELYANRPDRMRVIASGDPKEPILGYQYEAYGRQIRWPVDRIRHVKTFNPTDDWYGLAPLHAAARVVDQANAAQAWNTALLQSAARPSGAFVVKTKLGPDQRDALKADLRDQYEGAFNAGRPLLLENDADWKTMGQTPVEMDWLKGLNLTIAQIALAFGVPPEFLGIQEAKKYSNYQEARRAFYLETVLPLADELCEELTAWLGPQWGDDVVVSYDRSKIEALQEDRKVLWERADSAFEKGWITMDEARGQVNLDPHPVHGAKFKWEVGAEVQKDVTAAAKDKKAETAGKLAESGHARQQEAADKAVDREVDKADRLRKVPPGSADERKALDARMLELKARTAAAVEHAARAPMIESVQGRVMARMTADAAAFASAEDVGSLRALVDSFGSGETAEAWEGLIAASWMAAGKAAGERLMASLGPSVKGWTPPETKANSGWLGKVMEYLAAHGASKVKDILETTRNRLRAVLEAGVRDEKPYAAIRDEIMAEVADSERAWTIARTEVHGAAETGRFEAAKSIPGVTTKTWNATGDTRVRHPGSERSPSPFDHKAADGQTVPVDEPFVVSGEKMMHPGDWSLGASKGNTIQCRCLATYNLEEGMTA